MTVSEAACVLPPALVARFVRHLAEVRADVTEIEAQLASTQVAKAALLERLRVIAHKLAGTAGAYGFAELGGAASPLEQAIRADSGEANATTLASLARFREALTWEVSRAPA